MVRNIEKRRDYEPRGSFVFKQFTEIYIYTKNGDEAIDTVCLKNFIKDLKKVKYFFTSEKDLIKFAKDIFKKLKIKKIQMDKYYYIKPICKYDIVLNSSKKNSKKLVNELFNK